MKKTNNPLVSVCISIYNNEEFIEQAIESVLALTFWYKALAEAKGKYINLLPVEMTTSQSDHFSTFIRKLSEDPLYQVSQLDRYCGFL